jgi:hypothetical protein
MDVIKHASQREEIPISPDLIPRIQHSSPYEHRLVRNLSS